MRGTCIWAGLSLSPTTSTSQLGTLSKSSTLLEPLFLCKKKGQLSSPHGAAGRANETMYVRLRAALGTWRSHHVHSLFLSLFTVILAGQPCSSEKPKDLLHVTW